MRAAIAGATLLLTLLHATPALARDGAFSLAISGPIEQPDQPGIRVHWQETLGRRLVLAAGLGYSEPRGDSGERETSLTSRLAMTFDAGIDRYWYPWAGLDQPTDAVRWPDGHFGLGLESEWVEEVSGFAEVRYQPGLDSPVQVQVGVRLWPSRLNRLDARTRSSDPVEAEAEAGFSGRIELIGENEPPAAGPTTAAPPPVADTTTEAPAPATPEAAAEPVPPPEPQPGLGHLDLTPGVYLHLGLFRDPDSIGRYRTQVADYHWAEDLKVHQDPSVNGRRVLLGPFAEAEARRLRQSILDAGLDAFVYRVNPAD